MYIGTRSNNIKKQNLLYLPCYVMYDSYKSIFKDSLLRLHHNTAEIVKLPQLYAILFRTFLNLQKVSR